MNKSAGAPRIRIRDMTIDDLSAVFSIGNRVFTSDTHIFLYRTWETYEVTGLFTTDPELCIVAEYSGSVIGFALGSIIEKPKSSWAYGYLVWTGVEPKFQKHHVGGRLYIALEKRVIKLGARIMIIDTEGTNRGAINFFEGVGFRKRSQHLWMTKSLPRKKS